MNRYVHHFGAALSKCLARAAALPACLLNILSQTNAGIGLAAALLTSAWAVWHSLYHSPMPLLSVFLAVLGVCVLASLPQAPERCWICTGGHVIMLSVLCALAVISIDRLLLHFEVTARPPHLISHGVTPLLRIGGYATAVSGQGLHIDHPDGLVTIIPSFDKLAFRPLAEFWFLTLLLHLACDRRRTFDLSMTCAILVLAAAFVRFALCTILYLEHDKILTLQDGLHAISIYTSPWVYLGTLLACGALYDCFRNHALRSPRVNTVAPPLYLLAKYFALSMVMGMLIGFTWHYDPPGRQKQGRILFDDRFCGVWEPTARLLDTKWYGDFSTYSFSSLAEWLGHWFVVDVNVGQRYTDEFLARYDILVLKTVIAPIPEEELEAIDRFVQSGGSLLLVGDHTNLLGMGTHLNSLCDKYGLRFRYDSVSDAATSAFVNYFGPALGRSVGALTVDHLQFMTSCSLEVDSRAAPIIIAPSCRRDPHDYANSSFFGHAGPHPEMAHGPAVLVASVRVGKGRIAAFTDSTIWSSFAVFQFDRHKLAADLVSMLNRNPSAIRGPLRIAFFGSLLLACVISYTWIQAGGALPLLCGALIGLWGGVFGGDCLHRIQYALGPPRAPLSEVTFLWQGGSCAFPPVLGNIGGLPLDRAFDTLFVSTQRLGLVPRIAYSYDRDLLTPDTKVLFVIAPVNPPPESTLSRIIQFVERGGVLIVFDDGRLQGTGSAGDYLRPFGITLHYKRRADSGARSGIFSSLTGLDRVQNVPAPDTFIGRRRFGEGHVVYAREASDYSRTAMGHCFSRPGKAARSRYNTIFGLLSDVFPIAPADRRFYGICE